MTEVKHYDFKHYIKKRRYLIAGCSAVLLQLALGATSVQAASTNPAAVTVQESAAQNSKEETGQKQPMGDAVKKDNDAPAAAEGDQQTAKDQQEAKPANKTEQDQQTDKDDKSKTAADDKQKTDADDKSQTAVDDKKTSSDDKSKDTSNTKQPATAPKKDETDKQPTEDLTARHITIFTTLTTQ